MKFQSNTSAYARQLYNLLSLNINVREESDVDDNRNGKYGKL